MVHVHNAAECLLAKVIEHTTTSCGILQVASFLMSKRFLSCPQQVSTVTCSHWRIYLLFVLYALHCKGQRRRGKEDDEEGRGGGNSSASADGGREGAGGGLEGAEGAREGEGP